ncbi:MAG: hypothetical protein AAGE05_15115 [Pseudomonadota bacterium]
MIGNLTDVFEITGRGVVVTVEIQDGECFIGDKLVISPSEWEITGIKMINYGSEGVRRMQEEDWNPPIGILLGGAKKADLIQLIGREVETVSAEGSKQ